jgi:hypothetical protein
MFYLQEPDIVQFDKPKHPIFSPQLEKSEHTVWKTGLSNFSIQIILTKRHAPFISDIH